MIDDYEAGMDMETVLRADAIRRDPGRMRRAFRFAKDQARKMDEAAQRLRPKRETRFDSGLRARVTGDKPR